MRTNIELDEALVAEVMRRYRLKSKREAVHLALQRLAGDPLTKEDALALRGSGWTGDLGHLRAPRAAYSG